MKTKEVKIVIKTSDELKTGILGSLSGKNRFIQKPDEKIFNGVQAFTEMVSFSEIEVLIHLNHHRPESVYQLARDLKRDFQSVHLLLRALFELELVELEPSEDLHEGLIPVPKYESLRLLLA